MIDRTMVTQVKISPTTIDSHVLRGWLGVKKTLMTPIVTAVSVPPNQMALESQYIMVASSPTSPPKAMRHQA